MVSQHLLGSFLFCFWRPKKGTSFPALSTGAPVTSAVLAPVTSHKLTQRDLDEQSKAVASTFAPPPQPVPKQTPHAGQNFRPQQPRANNF